MTEKILYIEIFQPFAQYRNPFTFYYAQTYPLPPKSTIIGMLQNATDSYYDERFWDLKISVHGGFESVFWNYQQLIKGEVQLAKKGEKLLLINQKLPLYNDGLKSQRTPVYQQELFNGHLYIFIRGNEALLNEIERNLKSLKKILCLGRSEDIIFIRNINFVDKLEEKTVKKSLWLMYPTYIKQKHKEEEKEVKEFPIKNNKFPVYSIPVKVIFKNKKNNCKKDNKKDDRENKENKKIIKNKAEITKDTERIVEFETVIHTGFDYIVYLNKEIEVEVIRIDNEKVFKIPVDYGWL